MRLGGRAGAAIEILADIEDRHRTAALALRDWGLSHRFAGSGDRAAIGNLVYDTLRRRMSQAWRMDCDAPRALVLATLLDQWKYSPEELKPLLADDRFAPEFDWDACLPAWTARVPSQAPDYVRADIPKWTEPEFWQAFGARWVEEGRALATRPPLDLRANTLKASRERVSNQLSRHRLRNCACAPQGLRIEPGARDARLPNVQAEAGYRKGWFEIQDEGSQLAASLAEVRAGEQVLDFCAGAGGKTLAFSADMGNRGQVHAHDSDRHRLAPIHERLRRAGTRNVQVHGPDADLAALESRMDCVFVDAPCTGSGTWRRRPDAKWRLDEARLGEFEAKQAAIIADAARYVRPGGRLVYVTCSVLPRENAGAVERFCLTRSEFGPDTFSDRWTALRQISLAVGADGHMMLLTPATTQTDGFFVARLTRNVF